MTPSTETPPVPDAELGLALLTPPGLQPAMRLARQPRQRTLLARKSWVAYVRPLVWALFWVGFVPVVIWSHLPWVGISSVVVGASAAVYRVLWLRSTQLWMDEYGVTLNSGVFPWQRGEWRVRWRDIETVGCDRDFMRWAFRFSSVYVWQRFKDEAALVATDMAQGSQACTILNSVHLQWIEDRAKN